MKTLEILYEEMRKLTFSMCKEGCLKHSYNCCNKDMCEIAMKNAASHGKYIEPTGHTTLPMMGAGGCVVPAHLRPLCTVHICERLLYKDNEFMEKYFKLRDKLSEIEMANEVENETNY